MHSTTVSHETTASLRVNINGSTETDIFTVSKSVLLHLESKEGCLELLRKLYSSRHEWRKLKPEFVKLLRSSKKHKTYMPLENVPDFREMKRSLKVKNYVSVLLLYDRTSIIDNQIKRLPDDVLLSLISQTSETRKLNSSALVSSPLHRNIVNDSSYLMAFCDLCFPEQFFKEVNGVCFKCNVCNDFVLCETCINRLEVPCHREKHPMMLINLYSSRAVKPKNYRITDEIISPSHPIFAGGNDVFQETSSNRMIHQVTNHSVMSTSSFEEMWCILTPFTDDLAEMQLHNHSGALFESDHLRIIFTDYNASWKHSIRMEKPMIIPHSQSLKIHMKTTTESLSKTHCITLVKDDGPVFNFTRTKQPSIMKYSLCASSGVSVPEQALKKTMNVGAESGRVQLMPDLKLCPLTEHIDSTMSEQKDFKPVSVKKPIPNTYDLGNLATFDPNPLDNTLLNDPEKKEEHLAAVTRDNLQLLINQVLSLPIKTTTESQGTSSGQDATMTLIQLPEPTTPLPREKAIPKPKPPTKWEQFAAKKGIKAKAKEGKMVYDEASGEWVPKWGYKGKNKALDDQWLVEIDEKNKGTSDELIDPRTLKRAERKKLVKKNELQHKRNLKRSQV